MDATASFVGPLTFVILTDDLRAACSTHKLIDDMTLTEVIKRNHAHMQLFVGELVQQATQHNRACKLLLRPQIITTSGDKQRCCEP